MVPMINQREPQDQRDQGVESHVANPTLNACDRLPQTEVRAVDCSQDPSGQGWIQLHPRCHLPEVDVFFPSQGDDLHGHGGQTGQIRAFKNGFDSELLTHESLAVPLSRRVFIGCPQGKVPFQCQSTRQGFRLFRQPGWKRPRPRRGRFTKNSAAPCRQQSG